MNFQSLAYVAVIYVLLVFYVVERFWPRDDDGDLLDLEDFEKFLINRNSDAPRPPGLGEFILSLVFMSLGMIAIALSKPPSP